MMLDVRRTKPRKEAERMESVLGAQRCGLVVAKT